MSRIIAIDYGRKRCGVAVTDPLQIIANGLPTVPTHNLMDFIKDYCSRENVEMIIVGEPRQMDGSPSESARYIEPFLEASVTRDAGNESDTPRREVYFGNRSQGDACRRFQQKPAERERESRRDVGGAHTHRILAKPLIFHYFAIKY